jgi:succinoglycan biosynthesis transport protein ExoP
MELTKNAGYEPLDNADVIGVRSKVFDTPMLLQYWRSLRRNKWIVAGIIIGCLVIGLVLTMLATPVYTATSRIEISRQEENITNVEGLRKDETGPSLEFYQTQYSLLESRSLAERVARTLNLANDDEFVEAFGLAEDADGATPANARSAAGERLKQVVSILQGNVAIDPIRGSSLVDVSFTSPSAELSAKIANAWTEQFIASNLDRRFASTNDARDFLQRQLAQLRERLESSERDLVNYASNKRIIALSTTQAPDGRTTTERTLVAADLEALNNELASATAARIAAESVSRSNRGVSAGALQSQTIAGLRQQRALVQADYAKILTQFEPSYPVAEALKSQIDALDQSIAAEENRVSSNVSSSYQQALSRERQLAQRVESLKDDLISQRRDSIQYAIFQREVDTNRELYDALLQRYKEIGVAGVGSNNVAIVDRAEVPGGPSSPILALNLVLAMLAGLGLSAALITLIEYIDQRVKDPQEIDRQLGIPLLGSVPQVRDLEIIRDLVDRKSVVSEAYLSIKTNLSFLTEHGVPTSFMLTSTAPNEGKTVSSFALAATLAKSGARVVLIDADLRNPSIRSLLGLPANLHGLANYLAGEDDWRRMLQSTETPGMAVMDAGPKPPNPAELLSGARLEQLVRQLGTEFDHVVIDGPPILGLADAPLLSTAVEGVIIAVEANRHRLRGIQSALGRLQAAHAHVLGAIITKLDEQDSAYGYGYGYGYDYGRSSEGEERPVPTTA